jgi:uncharacterized protein (TIGR01777 family)
MTGATGFIGRALALRLLGEGHAVTALVRDEARARSRLGGDIDILPEAAGDAAMRDALAWSDAVVNLAGEPLIGRWTAKRKQKIIASRVEFTERLVAAMRDAESTPRTLISASAVGYYGDRGDEILSEDSAAADGFLSDLCTRWEQAAMRAEELGTRVVTLRTGIVLGREGGALAKLLTPFRLGLGGPIGSGQQYMPWIHLHDHVELTSAALRDDRLRGPLNLTAPEPVTSATFAKALGRALRRPAFLPLPSFALKAALGEAATVLLSSQRAVPQQAVAAGFSFQYPEIDEALAHIVGRQEPVDIRLAEGA